MAWALWEAALVDAIAELEALTPEELEGATSDSGVSWKIVQLLLENMPGRRVPFRRTAPRPSARGGPS